MPNKLSELRNLYFSQSQYSANQSEKTYDSLLQWPANGYFDRMKSDTDLLEKALSPFDDDKIDNLSEQVFGHELKQQYVNLKHSANLLYERSKLHNQHIHDIKSSHVKIQEKLFITTINNFPDGAKRISNLESQLLQLEQQTREEELAFWKDTVELRQGLFETAADYRGTKHRYSIFADVEDQYGR